MTMMINKPKLLGIFFFCIFILWLYSVINVNRQAGINTDDYSFKEEIVSDDISISADEGHLFSYDEYVDYFNVRPDLYWMDGQNFEYKIICVKLHIKNQGDKDILLENIGQYIGYGFETATWCSSVDPLLCEKINVYYSDRIGAGEELEVWLATTVLELPFRETTWENIDKEQFYYVIETYPDRKRIKLDINYMGEK